MKLTAAEIVALDALERDALVAERVMGWRRVVDDTYDYDHKQHMNEILLPPGETLDSLRDALPRKGQIPFGYFVHQNYSTSDAAALEVLAKLADVPGAQWYIETTRDENGVKYFVLYDPDDKAFFEHYFEHPSLATAITVVALLAVGAERRE